MGTQVHWWWDVPVGECLVLHRGEQKAEQEIFLGQPSDACLL